MRFWKCRVCHKTVRCERVPSSRLEINAPVHVEGNTYMASGVATIARHYGPVCFGGERGEDYMQHEWEEVKAVAEGVTVYDGK